MKLICTYELNGEEKVTSANDLFSLREGFWIDSSGKFCMGMEAETFIMSHMIRNIRKENDSDVVDADYIPEEGTGD